MVQEKIEMIRMNNNHMKTIEELKAELAGSQFTIDTLRATIDLQCVNYDDEDGNDSTFIQLPN